MTRPAQRTTINRWAIIWSNAYQKDFSSDVGYLLFETRKEALEHQEAVRIKGEVIKVRVTIEPARP